MCRFCKSSLVGSNVGILLNPTVKSGWFHVEIGMNCWVGKTGCDVWLHWPGVLISVGEYICENFVVFFCTEFYLFASFEMDVLVLILNDILIAVLNIHHWIIHEACTFFWSKKLINLLQNIILKTKCYF